MKILLRILLGIFMTYAGINHFTNTESFLAQVPPFLPAPETIVYVSGVVEIVIGLGLIVFSRYRTQIGIALAIFLILIFPGNISQFLTATPAFGLDSDFARLTRLLFQPVLIFLALWTTDFAWSNFRSTNPKVE